MDQQILYRKHTTKKGRRFVLSQDFDFFFNNEREIRREKEMNQMIR